MLGNVRMWAIAAGIAACVFAHESSDSNRLPWNDCDRRRSRLARAILSEEFYPEVFRQNFTLPDECPFTQKNDMYLDNEQNKKEVRYQNWRCLYCNKVFKSEDYLENHFQNRHPHTIKSDGVCLADFCGVLECDMHNQHQEQHSPTCNPKTMQKRQHRCQSLVDKCFPRHHSDASNQLHHYFESLYCSHLICDASANKPVSPPSQLLSSSIRKAARGQEDSRSEGWRKLGIVLSILFVLLLIIFYLGVCLYRKDMSIMDDLRKLSSVRRKRRLELIKSKQF